MTNNLTVKRALVSAISQLSAAADSDRRLDAEVLLASTLGRDRAWLYAWPEHRLSTSESRRFEELLVQRAAGRPIAYLTGVREFWGLELALSEATLIPRPETETLIELTLELVSGDPPGSALDLGTGSGAIALALAQALPRWSIVATAALEIARRNAEHLDLGQVRFVGGDWFAPLIPRSQLQLIVSNPPYVADNDPHLRRGDVRFEPRTALTAGPNGLDDLQQIVTQASPFLADQAWLILEHGADQGLAVRKLLLQAGFENVGTYPDLSGLDRVSCGRRGKRASPGVCNLAEPGER